MALTLDWSLVATIPGNDLASGICNIGGGKMRAVVGLDGPYTAEVWESSDDGKTWHRASSIDTFSKLGICGEDWTSQNSGLLCYRPGTWMHAEDGVGPSSGDAGGIIRVHPNQDSGSGQPIGNISGWSQFGKPCLTSRKDVDNDKFAIWPGAFLYDVFGLDAGLAGTLLLELTASGSTSLTTAYLMHELSPGYAYAAGVYPDGSIMYIWVTQPPTVGTSIGSDPSGFFSDGWFFFMLASYDGTIWRPYGDNQLSLSPGTRNAPFSGGSYNYLGEAFFLSDGMTLLLGVNVSGLSPCIFKSTSRGLPGTLREKVMPGLFYNYVPEGVGATFIFSGLYVMTHAFCELDDGTVLCAGGAPTVAGAATLQDANRASIYGGTNSYHYPVVWRSHDKGETWTNVSLGVEGAGSGFEADYFYEGRALLALGGQSALMACLIYSTNDPNWTPFFITEDGGTTWKKSAPANRVGMFSAGANPGSSALGSPVRQMDLEIPQLTFANDGAVLAIAARYDDAVCEIWRGVPSTAPAQLEHRAVGFVENAQPSATTFVAASIPPQELIRG